MLPTIPVVAGTTVDLLRAQLPAARALVAQARRMYTPVAVRVADAASRAWLARTRNPYLAEMDALAAELGEPGLHLLNLSYEWGCTTGVADGVLHRTLDWPFPGLGRHVAVLDGQGVAGRTLSVTWPGFAGALTALAPGRFAVAINQAKALHGPLTRVLEWPVTRLRVMASTALPPTHLLRRVCDEAPDYDTAVRMLSETPLCMPVFFSIAAADGRGAVIEREPQRAHLHKAPVACANHWHYPGLHGNTPRALCRIDAAAPYTQGSRARHAAMLDRLATIGEGRPLNWLAAPILCPDTRLACTLDAGRGRLTVVGVEGMAQATEILELTGGADGGAPYALG
ncbi:MAG: hypothetical protein ACM33T_01885 [Solirubrobacterales bacterium]